ncbi:MAG: LysR family transcriptional regulator substrate-binding protein, partial [Methylocella sp.]
LFKTPYMLAIREDHRFANRPAVNLSDLAGEPFILPERCPYLQDVTNALISRGMIRFIYRTDAYDRALALVAAGIGLALVPAHFEVSAVKQVPVLDLSISRAIGLLWSREREHAGLKQFIEFAGGHRWTQ